MNDGWVNVCVRCYIVAIPCISIIVHLLYFGSLPGNKGRVRRSGQEVRLGVQGHEARQQYFEPVEGMRVIFLPYRRYRDNGPVPGHAGVGVRLMML
jgi:hypothetical protein